MTTPTTPFEDKVRDAMLTFTEDIEPPSDALERIKRASLGHGHRRLIGGSALAIAAAVVAVIATAAALHHAPTGHVAVKPERPPQVQPAPTHKKTKPSPSPSPSVVTTPATVTPTSAPRIVRPTPPDACPRSCVGRATADVDGDGRADRVGVMVTQDAKPPAEAMQMLVRVVFADGRTVDYRDSGTLHVGLIGAADVNGDGRAEIFYLNTAGAHSQGGHILRWNGSSLAAVLGPDGKAYTTSIDSEATNYHDAGVACEGNRFVEYVGGLSDKYRLTKTTYAWNGNQLTQVSKTTTTYPGTDPFNPPKAITDIVGVKCPGLPA